MLAVYAQAEGFRIEGLSIVALPPEALKQLDAQGNGDLRYRLDAGLPLSPLDEPDIGAVEPRRKGEPFLRDPTFASQLTEALAEPHVDLCRVVHTASVYPRLLAVDLLAV